MGSNHRRHGIAAALIATVFVAGCAAPAATPVEPSPRPAAPTVSTPSPTPTPTPSPVSPPRLPALEELVISPAGIRPLLIGQSASEANMILFYPGYCQIDSSTEVANPADASRWVSQYEGVNVWDHPFNVHVEDGLVTALEVRHAPLATARGIRIGSSLQQLIAAYPTLVDGKSGHASRTLVHATPQGDLVFEVTTTGVHSYDGYESDTVFNIRIFPAGEANPKPIFGTDDFIGGCM